MAKSSRCVQFLAWIYLICSTLVNSDVDNITYDGDIADGEMLVELGKRIQKPLLILIGMAIRNQHPCSEWAHWTPCTARNPRYFGTKKRTRKCSTYKMPEGSALSKVEEDINVCVVSCAAGYNVTANGYCFKLYGLNKNWKEAEQNCKNDGGHLVYIDSDAKFSDVKKMAEGVSGYIWIDGRRQDSSSPWVTSHGDKLTKYYWLSGQPQNFSTDLCLLLDIGKTREWHDANCNDSFASLCEIAL